MKCLWNSIHRLKCPILSRWGILFLAFLPLNLGFALPYSNLNLMEAIVLTIKYNTEITQQHDQTLLTYGVFQSELGLFDANLGANAQYTHDAVPRILTQRFLGLDKDITDRQEAGVSLNKETQQGAIFGAQVVATRLQSNLQSVLLLPPENRGEVNFTVQVPIFKGRDAYANAAAAQFNHEASIDDMEQVVSQNVLNTILAYYGVLGARDRYNTLVAAVASSQRFVRGVRELIKADERPKSDIHLALAFLQERMNLKIAAEQALIRAKQNLGITMGIPAAEVELMPVPTAKLPPVDPSLMAQYRNVKQLAEIGSQKRGDVKGDEKRLEAADVLLKKARSDMYPQVNFNGSVGYRGLHEETPFLSGLTDNISGPVALARLSYSFPVGNHLATGKFVTLFSERSKIFTHLRELVRTIELNINLYANQLVNSAAQIAQTTAATINYRIAERNEIRKLMVGQSTVIDAIRVSDQRLNADLDNIDNKVLYASSVPQLRFESGTLIQDRGRFHYSVNLKGIPHG